MVYDYEKGKVSLIISVAVGQWLSDLLSPSPFLSIISDASIPSELSQFEWISLSLHTVHASCIPLLLFVKEYMMES